MVGEEFRGNANVLSNKVKQGPRRLRFAFHRVDVNKVLTRVRLELRVLTQQLDIDWHGVGTEEGTETSKSHGQGVIAAAPDDGMDCLECSLLHGAAEGESGLEKPNAPLLSK